MIKIVFDLFDLFLLITLTVQFLVESTWQSASVLMAMLLAYCFTKFIADKSNEAKTLALKVEDLALQVLVLSNNQETVNKQAEQVQKLISNSNLASAFTLRK